MLPERPLDDVRAAVSGVLLALSFPSYGHPAIAWIALAPLLTALAAESPSRFLRPRRLAHAFRLGLLTGVVYFTGTLYWITGVMANYGDLATWVAVPINAALIAYLALFPAIFAVVVRRLILTFGGVALLVAPFVWTATELGRTYIFTGFPWVLLGYSQTRVLPIVQIASLVGVYGVSTLVAMVSASCAYLAINVTGKRRAASAGPLAAALGLVVAVAAWGSWRVAQGDLTRTGAAVRVGLIQGNVDQGEKMARTNGAEIFGTYINMTRQAIGAGAELVIWPESSTPFRLEEDQADADRVRAIAREARVSILLGSDQFEHDAGRRYYNAAFMLGRNGATAGVYRKMHLVPFGEYVPLQKVLFFAAPLVKAVSDFSAGEQPVLLPAGAHVVSTSICYEVVYPDLVRQFVAGGSELLTTITNDAWFGATSAPYQHFEQASMRAIENGRYLVRAANTGISGIVDPYGRVLAESAIYQPAVVVGEARYLRTSTFYTRHGDVIAYASALATLALLLLSRRIGM